MLEKPSLDDSAVAAALREHYGLDVSTLRFLPIGNDVGSYVYRVETRDGYAYFLKARRAPMYEPSVAVPRFLVEQGLHQIVAPLPTLDGALWVPLRAFNLILYPFIDGRTGKDAGLTQRQWTELGRVLKKLHSCELPASLRTLVATESFDAPYWVAGMQRLQALIDRTDQLDAIAAALVGAWQERKPQMDALMERTRQLGRTLHDAPRELVLCHSDIHTANVLVEAGGALHIVDWDQPIMAPKERDLMFYGAELGALSGGATEARHLFEGYGSGEVDPLAFAYYRYAWVMQDWVANAEEVLLYDDLGDVTRRNSLRNFKAMFDPGDVVDVAYASDSI